MEALIATFHIEPQLILAQFVNFGIVLAVLWFFALKPVMKIMNERTETIDKSLKKAEQIEKDYESAKAREKHMLAGAQKEAQALLASTKHVAEEERARLKEQTKAEIEALVAEAKRKIASEKEKAAGELRQEVAELVIAATEKVLSEKAPKGIDKKLVEEIVKEMR